MPDLRFEIDEDIRKAYTLPGRFYTNPSVFDACRERIFAHSWQFVGDSDLVRVPGSVYPFTLLDGCLDEPLLLTRDTDDRLHCLSNVCTHRGNIVCEGAGVERSLRCRYHGRRFRLDGSFEHMPEFAEVEGFPSESDNLTAVPLESIGKFLFASLDPHVEFSTLVDEMRGRLAWLPLDCLVLDESRSRDYLVRANWALYCENYLEGFHIPFVHASLDKALNYQEYHVELYPLSVLQLGIASSGTEVFAPPTGSQDQGRSIAAYYWWLFPNTLLNVYPWGISVNVVRPLSVDRTKVSFISYVWDAAKLDQGAGSDLDRVEREDEAIVEACQRGLGARLYTRGRYSPTREQGVHHFHRLLTAALAQ
jgi:choline monooxygenase